MKKSRWIRSEGKKALPYISPGVLVMLLLIVYPLVYIITMSFSENGIGQSGFAWLANFVRLFKNPQFGSAVYNSFRFTICSVVLSFAVGLVMALLINQKDIKGKGFWRSMLFIAWVIPGVVKATAWKWILQTEKGVLNSMLQGAGLISAPIPWLTNPTYAMWAVTIVQVWACAPYVMLMMTAGLQQMPKNIYEAADIDGAGTLRKLFRITLPMLKDICFICILMLTIWALNEFSLIWIMTSGGQNTTTLSLLIYNQFKVLNINSASASAIIQLIITMIFAGTYVKLITKDAR